MCNDCGPYVISVMSSNISLRPLGISVSSAAAAGVRKRGRRKKEEKKKERNLYIIISGCSSYVSKHISL
jgi:hypothetical protein